MDDTAQKLTDQTQVIHPVSVAHKEGEPIINSEPIITRSEQEPNLHPEVVNAGVEVVRDSFELNDEHKAVGIKPAGVSVPVPTEPTTKIKFPLSEEQADAIIKTQKSEFKFHEQIEGEYGGDSLGFLATLVKKIFKKIHGKFISQPA